MVGLITAVFNWLGMIAVDKEVFTMRLTTGVIISLIDLTSHVGAGSS